MCLKKWQCGFYLIKVWVTMDIPYNKRKRGKTTQTENCCFHNPHHFLRVFIVSTNFIILFFLFFFHFSGFALHIEGGKSRKGSNYYEPNDITDVDDTESMEKKERACTLWQQRKKTSFLLIPTFLF